jgi:hypothetical protein
MAGFDGESATFLFGNGNAEYCAYFCHLCVLPAPLLQACYPPSTTPAAFEAPLHFDGHYFSQKVCWLVPRQIVVIMAGNAGASTATLLSLSTKTRIRARALLRFVDYQVGTSLMVPVHTLYRNGI